MKRTIYLTTLLLFVGVKVYSQHSGTILTPKGNSVEYYNGYLGDTAAYRAYADSLIESNNWDATMVAPGTHEYNCHAFAWHTSEGGPEYDRWVNGWKDGDVNYLDHSETPTNTPTNIIEYWTNNGGYHAIPDKVTKAKVFYGSYWRWENTLYGYRWVNKKDHSAIVDSNTDYFVSK